jgi:protein-S-isoprenylcysteine O-methyltransferase Ste14
MRRALFLAYGTLCYAAFFVTFLYAIGWIGNLVVPRSVDVGPAGSAGVAIVVNLLLLSAFAIQHSGMARPAFKGWWTRIVPQPIERATYVLLSSAVMWALFAWWRPIPQVVWQVESPLAVDVLEGLFFAGFGLVFYATTLIDHLDLFGMRQVIAFFRRKERSGSRFVTPSLYRFIRHPLYVGWLTAFWAAPTMTVGHLLFAGVCTGYILVAIRLEERDLAVELGERYRLYRETTPMFVPRLRRSVGASAVSSAR